MLHAREVKEADIWHIRAAEIQASGQRGGYFEHLDCDELLYDEMYRNTMCTAELRRSNEEN